jgi:hypothetical protein
MKPGFRLALLCACVSCAPADHAPPPPPAPYDVLGPERETIATVDGVAVSLARFNLLFAAHFSRAAGESAAIAVKRQLAVTLIDELLVERAAKRRGITVSDAQLDAAVQEFAARFPSKEAFARYSASHAEQSAGVRLDARQRLLRDALAGVVANEPIAKSLRLRRRSDKLGALIRSLRAGAHLDNPLERRLVALLPVAERGEPPRRLVTGPIARSQVQAR